MPENPPEKAKKSKKLTITEKNPPKKPPHISEKVLFAPDCFSLCQSALAGLVGLWYNEGAVAGGSNLTANQLGALALVPAL